jgi:hypothetical protein
MNRDSPVFVYAMVPAARTSFKSFFDTGSLGKLLENPGQLRYAGWDLTTLGETRIVKGEYLEIKSAERKLLRLYEDGSFIVRVSAGEDFLSWGQNEEGFRRSPRLNPLAIVEFTLNFVRLCAELVGYLHQVPEAVELKVEIRNAFLKEAKLYLNPYSIVHQQFAFNIDPHNAPEPSMHREIRVSTQDLRSWPAASAFSLVEKIYTWFGLAPNQVPYVSNKDGIRFIDEELIKNARSN